MSGTKAKFWMMVLGLSILATLSPLGIFSQTLGEPSYGEPSSNEATAPGLKDFALDSSLPPEEKINSTLGGSSESGATAPGLKDFTFDGTVPPEEKINSTLGGSSENGATAPGLKDFTFDGTIPPEERINSILGGSSSSSTGATASGIKDFTFDGTVPPEGQINSIRGGSDSTGTATTANTPGPIVPTCGYSEHGIMQLSKDGCWSFQPEFGGPVQPIGGPSGAYRQTLKGVLTGNRNVSTFAKPCGPDPLIQVCNFAADGAVTIKGKILYYSDANGSCWTLESGKDLYLPLSGAKAFFTPNAIVEVQGILRPELSVSCNAMMALEVISFNTLENPLNCFTDYTQCLKTCASNNCYVACETIYGNCLQR